MALLPQEVDWLTPSTNRAHETASDVLADFNISLVDDERLRWLAEARWQNVPVCIGVTLTYASV